MPFLKPLADTYHRWQKRRIIGAYLRHLPKQLSSDYGHAGPYTFQQVERSIDRSRLSTKYARYAVAVFCTAVAQNDHRSERLRSEVGSMYFHGEGFTIADVFEHPDVHGVRDHGHDGVVHADGHHGGDIGGHH